MFPAPAPPHPADFDPFPAPPRIVGKGGFPAPPRPVDFLKKIASPPIPDTIVIYYVYMYSHYWPIKYFKIKNQTITIYY